MTQSPYGGAIHPDEMIVEQRTSILAILSLVFGLLCFIPGLGILGLICGIAALLAIASSGGRVAGKGLAIAGIVLSLLFSAIWIGGYLGMRQIWATAQGQVMQPLVKVVEHTEAGDWAAARQGMTTTTANGVTDDDFTKFRDAYQAELGSLQNTPTDFWSYVSGFAKSGKGMQGVQGGNNMFPIPATFSKGAAVLIFEFEAAPGTTKGQPDIKVRNIIIATPAGNKIMLWDPSKAPLPVVAPATPPPADVPGKDGTPKADEKK
jgi:hypothetical protein